MDRLPLYRVGHVDQFSSYDTTGGNDDGFNGTYSFLRKEGDGLVIAEMEGPGVINRIWTPTPSDDTIQFFFDGETTPRISLPFSALFAGNRFPFVSPVCSHEVGGYYCYLPITYRTSCKVILKGKMLFYQLQYRTYPEDSEILSYSPGWTDEAKISLQKVVDLWKNSGSGFPSQIYDQVRKHEKVVKIRPGEMKRIYETDRGGRIVGMEVAGISGLDRLDNRLLIRARWDGEENLAIHAPVKDLFGYHFGEKSMRSLLCGTTGNTSYCWYPMPFGKSAVIELEYLGGQQAEEPQEIGFTIYFTGNQRTREEGRFYAYWRRDLPAEGMPYEIIPQCRTRGHYAGTILNCQGLIPGTTGFFEGDDQAMIDGKLRIHGTGSEDYFNGGWYAIPDRWDMAHSLPSHGCLGYSIPMSRTGGYRHYLADKLSFEDGFSLKIEHGPEGNRHPVDYSSVAFYYADNALGQNAPKAEMVEYPRPGILKFPAPQLNILAFMNGSVVNGERYEGQRVLMLEPLEEKVMLAKFRIGAAVDGAYRLRVSCFSPPAAVRFKITQRQKDLTAWKETGGTGKNAMEEHDAGTIYVEDGDATLTVHVSGEPGSRFILRDLVLEEVQ